MQRLSRPDNIVLIAGLDAGFTPAERDPERAFRRTEMMSPEAIIHRWGHELSGIVEWIQAIAFKGWLDNGVDISDWCELTDKTVKFIQSINVQQFVDKCKSLNTDYVNPVGPGERNKWVLEYNYMKNEMSKTLFAIPSIGSDEFVYNMFVQFVKFGRVTLRGAMREDMQPYTNAIEQIFKHWVDLQKGKIIITFSAEG